MFYSTITIAGGSEKEMKDEVRPVCAAMAIEFKRIYDLDHEDFDRTVEALSHEDGTWLDTPARCLFSNEKRGWSANTSRAARPYSSLFHSIKSRHTKSRRLTQSRLRPRVVDKCAAVANYRMIVTSDNFNDTRDMSSTVEALRGTEGVGVRNSQGRAKCSIERRREHNSTGKTACSCGQKGATLAT